jgi:hypothetical protein
MKRGDQWRRYPYLIWYLVSIELKNASIFSSSALCHSREPRWAELIQLVELTGTYWHRESGIVSAWKEAYGRIAP